MQELDLDICWDWTGRYVLTDTSDADAGNLWVVHEGLDVTRPYSAVLGGLGRFGPLYKRIFFTIDYEGLYEGP